jgi:hypothetical protein
MAQLENAKLSGQTRLYSIDCRPELIAQDRYAYTMASLDWKWKMLFDNDTSTTIDFTMGMETYLMATEHWILPQSPELAFCILLHVSEVMLGSPKASTNMEGRVEETKGVFGKIDELMVEIIEKRVEIDGVCDGIIGISEHLHQQNSLTNWWKDNFLGGRVRTEEILRDWCFIWEHEHFYNTHLNHQSQDRPELIKVQIERVRQRRRRREESTDWVLDGWMELRRSKRHLEFFGLEKHYFSESLKELMKIIFARGCRCGPDSERANRVACVKLSMLSITTSTLLQLKHLLHFLQLFDAERPLGQRHGRPARYRAAHTRELLYLYTMEKPPSTIPIATTSAN